MFTPEGKLTNLHYYVNLCKIASEYEQEIQQAHIEDHPTAPQRRDPEQ